MKGEEKAIQMFKTMLEAKPRLNACGVTNTYDFRVGEEFFDNLKIAIKAITAIEDIKAEIKNEYKKCALVDVVLANGVSLALRIIDKHIQNESMFSDYSEIPYQFDNMTGSMNL